MCYFQHRKCNNADLKGTDLIQLVKVTGDDSSRGRPLVLRSGSICRDAGTTGGI